MAGNGKLFLKQDSSQRMTHEDDDRKPLQNITGGGGMILLGTSHGLKEATASQMCNSGYLIEYPSYNVQFLTSNPRKYLSKTLPLKPDPLLFLFNCYFYLKLIRNRTSGPEHNNMCTEQSWLENRNKRQTSGMTKEGLKRTLQNGPQVKEDYQYFLKHIRETIQGAVGKIPEFVKIAEKRAKILKLNTIKTSPHFLLSPFLRFSAIGKCCFLHTFVRQARWIANTIQGRDSLLGKIWQERPQIKIELYRGRRRHLSNGILTEHFTH